MAPLTKSEYYQIQGRLVEFRVGRSSARHRWQKASVPDSAVLKVEIIGSAQGKKVNCFNGCTQEQEIEAILMFQGKHDYQESTSVSLPDSLISTIEDHVSSSVNRIVSRYPNFASEDMVTAAFGDRIQEEFFSGESQVDITFQSYSSVVKEPINGADLSVVFDIKDCAGNRVIKTILIQAKRCKNANANINTLQGLREQIGKMSAITEENYVLLYHDQGFNIFKSNESENRREVSSLFGDVMRCNNGDKRKAVLASSLDSKHIVQFIVSE
ncbi:MULTISPECIES: hypothetical protein [Vibrio]|uniref:hypothetical protein n=1 Tax=Vibrio TaxID=662 RepID=UPI00168D6B58|nr:MULTISPECIES: hypothetical protein [Vibrio]EHD0131844.1 hypothetical protein [Vibrio alginolyticus]ELB2899257.1 hypothetical protein [Vibrio alginolyticus]ELI1598703.1 hypothetical protein [Vibrio alginolyticus]ELP9501479.1 hypothetical protein [Vibrio alginolyticus]MBO0150202.1 hypothetical protein [Vibrio sp. Vb2424]